MRAQYVAQLLQVSALRTSSARARRRCVGMVCGGGTTNFTCQPRGAACAVGAVEAAAGGEVTGSWGVCMADSDMRWNEPAALARHRAVPRAATTIFGRLPPRVLRNKAGHSCAPPGGRDWPGGEC